MPRTPEEIIVRLQSLPVEKLLDLLDSLAKGDLAAAKIGGGGVSRAELAGFQPDGETGALWDALEKRALFLLARTIGMGIMRALPGAVESLRGISADVGTHGDAEPLCEEHDTQTQALRIAQTNMLPKVNEQRRLAALSLFDLAQKLGLFDLAKGFRAPDIEADEEQELARMAAAQGIDYLPPIRLPEERKSRVQ